MKLKTSILLICTSFIFSVLAQEQKKTIFNLPERAIASLTKKYQNLDKEITKQTEAYITKLEKQEQKLQKQLHTKDSLQAKIQLASMQEHYKKLKDRLAKADKQFKSTNEYLPQLDSITTAANFLQTTNKDNPQLKELNSSLSHLQSKLQASAEIKRMMKERKELLKKELKDLGVTKELDAISKETYYYKQQLSEYKALLKDKDKARQKVLGLVKENGSFKEFMKKNGFLGKLFPEGGTGNGVNPFPVDLQTREQLLNELQQKFGSNNAIANGNMGGTNFIQQQLQKAGKEFNKIKADFNKNGAGVGDADMPNFKPNTQKGKSFLKRLEIGMNVQSVKGNSLLPTTSDIALTVGYKLNDKSTIGIGAAYKMGWGNGWQDIRLTTQGYGLRSFVDMKLFSKADKGIGKLFKNIWISGGYELNYLPDLNDKTYSTYKSYTPWQEAGMIGLSKKYSKGKKKAQVQLLYNLLYKQSYPQPEPLVFRVGWGL